MKRLAIIVAIVVAMLAVAIAAVPFVVPSDLLKKRVASRISNLTGRPVTFEGQPVLSIYPHLTITIDGLDIGNPKDMGTDPFLTADSLSTHLRLFPLLIGRVELDEFVLTRPTVHLVIDANGRNNWQVAGRAFQSLTNAEPPSPNDPLATNPDIGLGHLLATGVTVLYDDLSHATREQMTDGELEVTWPSAVSTASGRGKFTWRGEPLEFTALVAAPLQIMRGANSAARIAVASTPLRASFSGRLTAAAGALTLDGDATVTTPSLRRTIEWMGTPMGTGPILGAGSIQGRISAGERDMRFDDATIELDGNEAAGSLGISFDGPRPNVSGSFSADGLDLSAYFEATRASLAEGGAWLIAPARLPFAEAIDANISVTAGGITIGAIDIGKTTATVAIKNGGVDFTMGQAEFYTGVAALHLATAREGDALVAQADATFASVPARLALPDLFGISALDGNTTARLSLTTRGRSWPEFARAITGGGSIRIDNGNLTGIDLAKLADEMADPFAEPVTPGTGTTQFPILSANVSIAEGEVSTDNLFLTGDDLQLSLRGHGSFWNGAVDAQAVLTNTTETIPLAITGTWHEPVISRARTPSGD